MSDAAKRNYKFQYLKFYTNKQGLYKTKNFRKVFVDEEIKFLYAAREAPVIHNEKHPKFIKNRNAQGYVYPVLDKVMVLDIAIIKI